MSTSLPPVYYNNDSDSFAFSTARTRWIKIVQDTVDDVESAAKQAIDTETAEQGRVIASQLKKLKEDITNDGSVGLLPTDNGLKQYESFNRALSKDGPFTWLTGPWLTLENYLYRYMNSLFLAQSKWFNYDYFNNLKKSSFESSRDGVTELAIRYSQLSKELKANKNISDDVLSLLFREFAEISLWGNATDLSLLATSTLEDIKSIQGEEARKKSEDKILSNDIDLAYKQLKSSKPNKHGVKRVDFVLDNSGFELYTDLAFTLFLLDSKLTDKVILHTKDIPWMVSDVNIKDFAVLLDQLKDEKLFPKNRSEMNDLVNKIEYYYNTGILTLETSPFWTLEQDFWGINANETEFGGKELYDNLLDSTLIIFKGDMNYRKLTGDRRWKPTTKFIDAIGPLASNGLKVFSLRTVKADVLVGLKNGAYEQISEEWAKTNENKLSWLYSGKYAVISYSNGDN